MLATNLQMLPVPEPDITISPVPLKFLNPSPSTSLVHLESTPKENHSREPPAEPQIKAMTPTLLQEETASMCAYPLETLVLEIYIETRLNSDNALPLLS